MLFTNKTFLFLLFNAIFLFSSNRVYAQDNQASSASQSSVYQQDSFSRDIRQLKLQYRGELAEYRQSENLYLIAKNQYHKLNTLASLEEGVQKTQAAMVARDKVLLTYLRLLRLKLLSQPGIELQQKKAAEQSLLAAVTQIQQHQQQFEQILAKPQLNKISAEFEPLIKQVEEAAYQALTVISIGELQTIHDQAVTLEIELESKLATTGGALKSTARKRSFDETNRVLTDLKPAFDLIEKKYSQPSSSGYKGVYKSINKQLSAIHSSLAKALTFLGELLKI